MVDTTTKSTTGSNPTQASPAETYHDPDFVRVVFQHIDGHAPEPGTNDHPFSEDPEVLSDSKRFWEISPGIWIELRAREVSNG